MSWRKMQKCWRKAFSVALKSCVALKPTMIIKVESADRNISAVFYATEAGVLFQDNA